MKINILSPEVYNRIAAGEVVDRPYSVVKELVENAIDAGADAITIEIEGGGKKRVRVADNGSGIPKEELRAAYHPHATSKLSSAKDLFSVRTLGFRGEALASIASVSRMSICSKTADGEAWELKAEGGVLGEIVPSASADGTTVTVDDLFFNTPARLKFLKSDAQEEGDVSAMAARFILSRPHISFTYRINGKVRYRSFGDGLESALINVYGPSIVQNCYEISAEKNGIRLYGFIGNQNFAKPNRSYQTLFVNGRYVVNQTVSAAIANAYGNYLMKRQFAFYVLFLDIAPEAVDVNVHPNKTDVRFRDNQVVYGNVYSIISSVLDGNSRALEYVVSRGTSSAEQESAAPAPGENAPAGQENAAAPQERGSFSIGQGGSAAPGRKAPPMRQMTAEEARRELAFDVTPMGIRRDPFPAPEVMEVRSPRVPPQEDAFEENRRLLREAEEKRGREKLDPQALVYKGELFRTYLIYEAGDTAYLIDQHAAHERMLYDKLQEKMENGTINVQPLLVPYICNANAQEFAFLQRSFGALRALGFEIEEFGGTSVKVSALPAELTGMDIGAFFSEVLSSMETLRAIKLGELLRDKLAGMACKAAVKGGERLTEEEARALVRAMDGDMGLRCPHGRPVCARLTRAELEKLFKRTV